MQEASRHGRWADARALHDRLLPLADALFASPNPGPAKYALARMGRMAGDLRLPMTSPGADTAARLDAALAGLALEAAA
jgi:4-hydroxy-tetrahydrodipicolinate synthase